MSQTDSGRATVPGADGNEAANYNRLFDEFIDGATSGSHRRVKIVEKQTRTLLVAYNKWVYAEREKESGVITFYHSWATDELVTNASNLQAGRLRQRIEEMDFFNRLLLVEKDDRLIDVEGNEYGSVSVSTTSA